MADPKTCVKCGQPEGVVTFALEKTRNGSLRARRDCVECRRKSSKKYYQANPKYFSGYREEHKERYLKQAVGCNRERRHKRYALIKILKESKPCTDCGKSFPYFVMDFDHRDPSLKVNDVSTLVKTYVPWDRVLEEVTKCDLVCANCHRLRTYKGQTCYRTRRFEQHRTVLDQLKATTPCRDCGIFHQPCQMDFDHTGIESKVANIARLVDLPTKLVAELKKCHLVCANCHRVRGSTGLRPNDPQHTEALVERFLAILNSTPLPADRRVSPFPLPHFLGKVPDKELSAMTGISRSMVVWHRRKSGIVLNTQGNRVEQ